MQKTLGSAGANTGYHVSEPRRPRAGTRAEQGCEVHPWPWGIPVHCSCTRPWSPRQKIVFLPDRTRRGRTHRRTDPPGIKFLISTSRDKSYSRGLGHCWANVGPPSKSEKYWANGLGSGSTYRLPAHTSTRETLIFPLHQTVSINRLTSYGCVHEHVKTVLLLGNTVVWGRAPGPS